MFHDRIFHSCIDNSPRNIQKYQRTNILDLDHAIDGIRNNVIMDASIRDESRNNGDMLIFIKQRRNSDEEGRKYLIFVEQK